MQPELLPSANCGRSGSSNKPHRSAAMLPDLLNIKEFGRLESKLTYSA